MPELPDGQREFEAATGINIETDVDRIVAALVAAVGRQPSPATAPASSSRRAGSTR